MSDLMLVGSVPLADSRAVFEASARTLGVRLARYPDGETGPRANWIGCQRAVFERVAALAATTAKERDYQLYAPFALREGATAADVRFGPLGYASAAIASYAEFARLKGAGTIAAGARFLVALPTAWAPVYSFVAYRSQQAVLPAYVRALAAEIDAIAAAVPHPELSIQWDIATEMSWWERVYPSPFGDDRTIVEQSIVDSLALLVAKVPATIELGLHFCYGSMGNRHWQEPADLGACVALANRLCEAIGRPVGYLHMPVPVDRADDAYFAPLDALRLPAGCALYLGLLHLADGVAGALARIAAARRHAPAFGLACECGLGRHRPEVIPDWLTLHAACADAVAEHHPTPPGARR